MSLVSPVTSSLVSPLAAAVGAAVGGFSPAALFAGGIKGVALDLTSLGALYQDSARTTLVTAAGQPIGSPSDLSGNGAHPTQATAASRPTYNGFATFDGVDDSWATPTIDFTGTDKITVIAGVRKLSDAAVGALVEGPVNGTENNFSVNAPRNAATANYSAAIRSTTNVHEAVTASSFAAPHSAVVSGLFDYAAAAPTKAVIRVNGAATNSTFQSGVPVGPFGNYQLFIGRRNGATLPFNGLIYRLIVIGRALTAAELAQAERWCATAAGVAL